MKTTLDVEGVEEPFSSNILGVSISCLFLFFRKGIKLKTCTYLGETFIFLLIFP